MTACAVRSAPRQRRRVRAAAQRDHRAAALRGRARRQRELRLAVDDQVENLTGNRPLTGEADLVTTPGGAQDRHGVGLVFETDSRRGNIVRDDEVRTFAGQLPEGVGLDVERLRREPHDRLPRRLAGSERSERISRRTQLDDRYTVGLLDLVLGDGDRGEVGHGGRHDTGEGERADVHDRDVLESWGKGRWAIRSCGGCRGRRS